MNAFMPLLSVNNAPLQPVHTPMQKIRLHGELGRKFGYVHNLAVATAAEAVRALGVLLPGFDAWLTQSKDRGVGYAVFYGNENITKEELTLPTSGDVIRFAPIIIGSKSGGVFSIILGAVLVIVGAFVTGLSFGAAAPIGAALMNMGWGLIVAGVVQLLMPAPKGISSKDSPDNQASYSFNGATNTQAQGNPVGVLYGELIVGSAVISAGISAQDQAYIPTDQAAGGGGNGSGGGGGGGAPPWHEIFDYD